MSVRNLLCCFIKSISFFQTLNNFIETNSLSLGNHCWPVRIITTKFHWEDTLMLAHDKDIHSSIKVWNISILDYQFPPSPANLHPSIRSNYHGSISARKKNGLATFSLVISLYNYITKCIIRLALKIGFNFTSNLFYFHYNIFAVS